MSENVQTLNYEEPEGTVQIDLEEIIKKAKESNSFKKSLMEKPRETLRQIGVQVTTEHEINVVEESAKVLYLVLPSTIRQTTCSPECSNCYMCDKCPPGYGR